MSGNDHDYKRRWLVRWAIGNPFMESGYVDLRDFYGADLITFADYADAGKVYYPESLTDRLADTSKIPYLDEAVSDGDPPNPPKRGYSSGMDSEAFKATLPGDGPGDKRVAWNDYKAEYCTGKLRLLLQAQMGQKGPNPGDTESREYPLMQYGVPNSLSNTYALHTTDEYEYFLLTIGNGTVSAQKLTTKTSGELYDRLATAPDDEKKMIEAYLLGRARLSGNAETLNANFDAVSGTPFALGWKANWAGDELVIVTNEAILDEQNDPIYHTQRLYTLTVSITKDPQTGDYSMSASNTKTEEINCTPSNNIFIPWWPNYELGVMETNPWSALDGYPELIEQDSTPMYAHYGFDDNDDEQLIVYRHTLTPNLDDTGGGVATLTQLRSSWEASETLCIEGTANGEMQWFDDYMTEGIYVEIGGDAASRDGLPLGDSAFFVEYDMDVSADGETNTLSPFAKPGFSETSVPPYCGSLVDSSWQDGGRYPITVHGAQFSLTRRRMDGATIKGDSILIIPFSGEDCAYIGSLTGVGGQAQYFDATRDIYNKIVSQVTGATNGSQFAASGNGGGSGLGVGSGVLTPNSALHSSVREEQEYNVSFTFYGKYGPQNPVTLSVSSFHASDAEEAELNAYFQLGIWASWFDPALFGIGAGINERLILTQESAGTGVVIYDRDPTQSFSEGTAVTDDELPDGIRPNSSGAFGGWV